MFIKCIKIDYELNARMTFKMFYDVYVRIIEYLDDKNKMNMRLVNKYFRDFRIKLSDEYTYNERLVKIFSFTRLIYYHSSNDKLIKSCQYMESLEYMNVIYSKHLIVDNLPKSLLEIRFNEDFDECIDNLPPLVERLYFYLDFDQNIDKLPSNLKFLKLSLYFSQKINSLPLSLKTIKISDSYKYLESFQQTFKDRLEIILY
jgi:hypothetical protein